MLKKDVDPDFMTNVALLFTKTGLSDSAPVCVECAVNVSAFPVTLMVGVSLSWFSSFKWICWVDVCMAYAFFIVLHGSSLHPQ